MPETLPEIETIVRDYILREFLPGEDPAELTEETPLITGGILDSITRSSSSSSLKNASASPSKPTRPVSNTSIRSARSPA